MTNVNSKKFAEIVVGEIINVAGIEWIVLDKRANSILCLTKNFVYNRANFDDNTNNYAKSEIRKKLQDEVLPKITNAIGEDALSEVWIDLTSDDGLDDYGDATGKIGLLTADMYQKYNRIIEKYKVNYWWWLATPWTTTHRGNSSIVRVVCYDGALFDCDCNSNYGVRPFCIFKSNIF